MVGMVLGIGALLLLSLRKNLLDPDTKFSCED